MDTNEHRPGFQFDNFARNAKLVTDGYPMPKFQKTGTTIAGIIYKDGVVLGADSRATGGSIVQDKKCMKLHYLQPNIYCGGAGTAADLDVTTLRMSSQLDLLRLNTGRQIPVITAERMLRQMLFRYQGHIGAYLIVGGVDRFGNHVYSVDANGSAMRVPYTAMGSGSLAAMSAIEMGWKPNMELADAMKLVRDGITAGILNDLASGSIVNLCVINKDGCTMYAPYEEISAKGKRSGEYSYPKGTTKVLTTSVRKFDIMSEAVRPLAAGTEAMDTA